MKANNKLVLSLLVALGLLSNCRSNKLGMQNVDELSVPLQLYARKCQEKNTIEQCAPFNDTANEPASNSEDDPRLAECWAKPREKDFRLGSNIPASQAPPISQPYSSKLLPGKGNKGVRCFLKSALVTESYLKGMFSPREIASSSHEIPPRTQPMKTLSDLYWSFLNKARKDFQEETVTNYLFFDDCRIDAISVDRSIEEISEDFAKHGVLLLQKIPEEAAEELIIGCGNGPLFADFYQNEGDHHRHEGCITVDPVIEMNPTIVAFWGHQPIAPVLGDKLKHKLKKIILEGVCLLGEPWILQYYTNIVSDIKALLAEDGVVQDLNERWSFSAKEFRTGTFKPLLSYMHYDRLKSKGLIQDDNQVKTTHYTKPCYTVGKFCERYCLEMGDIFLTRDHIDEMGPWGKWSRIETQYLEQTEVQDLIIKKVIDRYNKEKGCELQPPVCFKAVAKGYEYFKKTLERLSQASILIDDLFIHNPSTINSEGPGPIDMSLCVFLQGVAQDIQAIPADKKRSKAIENILFNAYFNESYSPSDYDVFDYENGSDEYFDDADSDYENGSDDYFDDADSEKSR